jgi:hypothetical protein
VESTDRKYSFRTVSYPALRGITECLSSRLFIGAAEARLYQFLAFLTAESLASGTTSGALPPVEIDFIGRIHGHSGHILDALPISTKRRYQI